MNSFNKIFTAETSLNQNMAGANVSSFTMKQAIVQLQDIAASGIARNPFEQNYTDAEITSQKTPSRTPVVTIAAHSALSLSIFERALISHYGADFGEPNTKTDRTEDGYTYREAMEAARIYNLPRLKVKEDSREIYLSKYIGGYGRGVEFAQHVLQLAGSSEKLANSLSGPANSSENLVGTASATEKMLYLADRTSTIFMALYLDMTNRSGVISRGNPLLTDGERTILRSLPSYVGSGVKTSQFLAYKYLKTDNLPSLDDTGYFTALIIAYTLNVNGTWYHWREEDYV